MGKIDAAWYEENYTPWIDEINSYEDLEKFWDNLNPRYKRRFDHWFKDIEMRGTILELGFNNGKTLKWLSERYGWDIRLHGIDFNNNLEQLASELVQNILHIDALYIGDILKDGGFDIEWCHHITCLDFIEHLHHNDYLKLIIKIKELLKTGGRVYVFGGYAKQVEHVNILSTEQITEDFTAQGFKLIRKISHPETGDIMQIFEK